MPLVACEWGGSPLDGGILLSQCSTASNFNIHRYLDSMQNSPMHIVFGPVNEALIWHAGRWAPLLHLQFIYAKGKCTIQTCIKIKCYLYRGWPSKLCEACTVSHHRPATLRSRCKTIKLVNMECSIYSFSNADSFSIIFDIVGKVRWTRSGLGWAGLTSLTSGSLKLHIPCICANP